MKNHVSIALLATVFSFSGVASAQADHTGHNTAKPAPGADVTLSDAVVKKVDKSKGTLTLSHGALPNGMPPMTMAYKVKDATWLDRLQAGQKIRFATDPADGGMTVTRIALQQ